MVYQSRELRRLWEVELYTGNPDAKKPKTKKETVIAWNNVDAIRRSGGQCASEPVSLGFVTWPPKENPEADVYFIEDTAGPTNKKAKPSIEPEPGDWDF
jgi:hypothetical protein